MNKITINHTDQIEKKNEILSYENGVPMQIDWNRITTKTLLAGIKLHIIGNCHAWEIKPNRIRIEGFFSLKKTCCFNCGCVERTAIGGIIGRTDWLM